MCVSNNTPELFHAVKSLKIYITMNILLLQNLKWLLWKSLKILLDEKRAS